MEDNVRKRMYTRMCDWVTLLYCRKLTEYCKPTIMENIKVIKKRTTIWPNNLTLRHISRKETLIWRDFYPSVYCSIIYKSRDMEAMQISINRGMDQEYVVHIYSGIPLSHKKEWNNVIGSNMAGPRDYHTEWSKSDIERQTSYDIMYVWNPIKYNTKGLI